jgi:hypothetical protein
VEQYTPDHRQEWDDFVRGSTNGTFLFERGYMEYHADRFADCSLVIRARPGGAAVGLVPANRSGSVVESHGGLTFGGVIRDQTMTVSRMVAVLDAVTEFLRQRAVQALRYRAIPHVYHRGPAEEDLYALGLRGARLLHRAPLSVLDARHRVAPQKRRERGARRAAAAALGCGEHDDLQGYWRLLEHALEERYHARPVHTLVEMAELRRRFPRHIRLFASHAGGEMVAGVLVYESDTVARTQYIAASPKGRRLGALDGLLRFLCDEVFAAKPFIDLGTSESAGGTGPNAGVLEFKESLGARLVVQDTWELPIAPAG